MALRQGLDKAGRSEAMWDRGRWLAVRRLLPRRVQGFRRVTPSCARIAATTEGAAPPLRAEIRRFCLGSDHGDGRRDLPRPGAAAVIGRGGGAGAWGVPGILGGFRCRAPEVLAAVAAARPEETPWTPSNC